MNYAKAASLIAVVLLVLAARFAVNLSQVDQKAEQRKLAEQQAQEKVQRLASACTFVLSENDFAMLFPDKPRQDQFILIGSNDDDWHLNWYYDTSFSVERSELKDHEPQRLETDRKLLADAARQMVQDRNRYLVGKPDAWIVKQERELTYMELFAARELSYTYRKYTTELPREGRVWMVKVPGAIVTLHVDGEPEVVNSPLADSFLASYSYLPRRN